MSERAEIWHRSQKSQMMIHDGKFFLVPAYLVYQEANLGHLVPYSRCHFACINVICKTMLPKIGS